MPTFALILVYATATTTRVAAIANVIGPVRVTVSNKNIGKMPARSKLGPRVITARLDRELPPRSAKQRS